MIKLAGICALMLSCTGAGFMLSSGLSARILVLENINALLEIFSVSIRYKRETVLRLVEEAESSSSCRRLEFLSAVRERLLFSGDFPLAWRESVLEWLPDFLKPEDKAILLETGDFLGGSDIDGQLSNLQIKKEAASKLLDAAKEERKRKSKLFRSLGVLGGAFAAILLV